MYCITDISKYCKIKIVNKHTECNHKVKKLDKNVYSMYCYDKLFKKVKPCFILKHETDYYKIVYCMYKKQWRLFVHIRETYDFAPNIESLYIIEHKIYVIEDKYLLTYNMPTKITNVFSMNDLKIENKQILKWNDEVCTDVEIISYCDGTLFLKSKMRIFKCILGDELVIDKIVVPFDESNIIFINYNKVIGINGCEMIIAN